MKSQFDFIFFDADDTLLDFSQSARRAFALTLDEVAIPEREGMYALYQLCNHETWREYEDGKISAVQLRTIRFERFLVRAGLGWAADPAEMNTRFLNNLVQFAELLPGARELLEELRSQFGLALITNGLKEVQRRRLAHLKVDSYFSAIVVSDEIGVAKPDPAYFNYVLAQVGNPERERVLVVGDNIYSDIQGGQQAGMATCWYNPNGKERSAETEPTFEIAQLSALPGLLLAE